MDQHETTTPTERKPLGRRTVLKGAAWSVPAVVAVGATPAFAATGDSVTIESVTVAPTATEAPDTSYINLSNQDATVTVTGTATDGVTLVVTATGGYTSGAITATGGVWSVDIPAGSLASGTVNFTATVNPGFPSVTSPLTVTKDVVAPDPAVSIVYNPPPTKTLVVTWTLSALDNGTEDVQSGQLVVTGGTIGSTTTVTTSGSTTYTKINPNNTTYGVSLTQLDGAGNSATATASVTT